ncbi:MAG: DUF5665 domain-containing protein [Bacillota bacterium]|nr:DUF5665 domain-containing protein [Bacillota bacterium]
MKGVAGEEGRPREAEGREEKEERLVRLLEEFSLRLEKASLAEYVEFWRNPRRILLANLLAGLARGVGAAVGLTIVGAVVVYLLGRLAALHLPLIGEFIAELTRIVRYELKTHP